MWEVLVSDADESDRRDLYEYLGFREAEQLRSDCEDYSVRGQTNKCAKTGRRTLGERRENPQLQTVSYYILISSGSVQNSQGGGT